MAKAIRRVAVLGSGVMGSGIAAHMANAGFEVLLLDIAPKDAKAPRNGVAAAGLAATLKSKPAAFFHPSNAKLVSVGNMDDDLAKAVRHMETLKVRRLPVINKSKRMVGMLSLGDVGHSAPSELLTECVKKVSAHHH